MNIFTGTIESANEFLKNNSIEAIQLYVDVLKNVPYCTFIYQDTSQKDVCQEIVVKERIAHEEKCDDISGSSKFATYVQANALKYAILKEIESKEEHIDDKQEIKDSPKEESTKEKSLQEKLMTKSVEHEDIANMINKKSGPKHVTVEQDEQDQVIETVTVEQDEQDQVIETVTVGQTDDITNKKDTKKNRRKKK